MEQQRMTVQRRPVPFGKRLVDATQYVFQAVCNAICVMAKATCGAACMLVLAPVEFLRILFTSYVDVIVPATPKVTPPPQSPPTGNEGDDWFKEHQKEFGDD